MRLPMLRQRVQTMVDHHNIASTGQADWYPVAFFLRGEADEVLGGLLGEIWAGWLHVKNTGGGRAGAGAGLRPGTHEACGSLCAGARLPRCIPGHLQFPYILRPSSQRSIVDRDTRQDVHTRGSRWLFQPILCPALITNSETSVQPSTLQDVLEAQNNAHTGHPQYIWFCYASR